MTSVARIYDKEIATVFMAQFHQVSCESTVNIDRGFQALEQLGLGRDHILLTL